MTGDGSRSTRTRVLVLGGSGMLGHKLCQLFASRFETFASLRSATVPEGAAGLDGVATLTGVDLSDAAAVAATFRAARPDVVVNAAGLVKQRQEADDPVAAITLNALLPHRLAALCREAGARLVQISTDCVFSGRRGTYREDDVADCADLYGRSKLLGEATEAPALTLRTSIIGRELHRRQGLLEWFLGSAGGQVRGYAGVVFSGLPTIVLARLLADIVESHPSLCGLYHVASSPITKYDLLCLLRDAYGVRIDIERVPTPILDRSLDAARFSAATGFQAPSWESMVREMADDPSPYEEWRRTLGARG